MGGLNAALFQSIHGLAGQNAILDGLGIFFAEYFPYVLTLGFLILALRESGWRRKAYVVIEGALALVLAPGFITLTVHYFYFHPRPFAFYGFMPLISESGASFPSGHAAWFFALALVVFWTDRAWGVWYFIFAFVNGLARIYVGVHWPFDILGGAAAGVFAALFIRGLLTDVRKGLYGERQAGAA